MDENKRQDIPNLEDNMPGKHNLLSRLKKAIDERKQKKLQQLENEKLSDEESKRVEEKIEEATKEVSDKKSKNKKIKNIIFFIFNIVLVAGILLWNIYSTEDFMPLNLFKINYLYVFATLMLLACIIMIDVFSVHRMIYRKTLRSRWHLSYKSLSTLRYYDAVTPLSSGGQAFMVTYLTARDVPASTSLSIPIAKLLFQNISWLIITFVCLCVALSTGMGAFISTTSIIGFLLCALLVSVILFLSFSKKLGRKLVSWVIKLLVKIKILKDYDKNYEKVISFVEDYQNIMKEYSRAKLDVLYQIILHSIRFILLYSIPFFIYCVFMGYRPEKYGEFFMYTALIDLASSFIPLPGGTGMNEITFTYLFKQYLGGATFWALLLWRFCSYYFYLIQGIGVIFYDTVYGNRKYRWVQTKIALQKESQDFKRIQIENFRQERNKRRKKLKKEGLIE